MAMQLRIVGKDGAERTIDLQPGTKVKLAPGETATLVNTGDTQQLAFGRVGSELRLSTGEGVEPVVLEGFFDAVGNGGTPPQLVLESDSGVTVITGGDATLPGPMGVPNTGDLPAPEDVQFPESDTGENGGMLVRSVLLQRSMEAPTEFDGTDAAGAGRYSAASMNAVEIFAGSLDNAPSVFTIDSASGREGNSIVFTVTRSGSLRGTDTVDFETLALAGDSANPGTDFSVVAGTLTFRPGQLTQTITVDLLVDADIAEVEETFTVQLSNATTSRTTAEAQIDVADGVGTIVNNTPPTAQDDAIAVSEDSAQAGSLFANNGAGTDDANDANDSISVTRVNGSAANVGGAFVLASGASLTVNANGNFTYDPNGAFEALAAGETATETFSYTVTDTGNQTDTAQVTVTITGQNDPVVAVDDTGAGFAANEDDGVGVTASVLTNDSDPDIDGNAPDDVIAVLAGVGGSPIGTVTNNLDGTFNYDPNGQFEALTVGETTTDSFTYQVSDGTTTATASVSITITGQNDPVTATDDAVAVQEDDGATVITAAVLSNDTDPDIDGNGIDDTLSVVGFTPAATGTVTLVGGVLTYDTAGAFEALTLGETTTDTFTYQVSDGNGSTDTATVTVTVTGQNDDPTGGNDILLGINEDDVVATTTGNVLGNDTDPDIDGFGLDDTLSVVGGPVGGAPAGSVVNNGDGTFDYDPNGQFEALTVGETTTDSFTYQVTDGNGGTDTATVTVTITGQNDPVTAVNDSFTTSNLTGRIINVAQNDLDADIDGNGLDDTLTVLQVAGTALNVGDTVDVTNGALNTITANQAFVTLNGDGTLSYDPNGEFDGLIPPATTTDTFTYQISDGNGSTDTATVVMTVATTQPPVANPDNYSGGEDAVLNVPDGATDLIANDTDPDGNLPLTAVPGASVSAQGAAVTVNADGSFSYDPTGAAAIQALDDGESVADTFTYQVQDQLGAATTGTATITVSGANDAPTVVNDAYATGEDSVLNVPDGVTDLLNNDSDVDVEAINAIAIVGGASVAGAVVNVNANGSFSYDGTGVAAFQALDDGESVTDTFTYQVTDGTDTSTATVTITINGANDAPTVVNDAYATGEDNVLNVPDGVTDLLNNDSDIDVEAINAIAIVGGASVAGAVVNVNANGSFSYDGTGVAAFQALDDGESTTDTFTYQVTDGTDTSTATVTITINGANDAPTVVNDAYATGEDSVLNVPDGVTDLLNNDSDIDVEAINAIAIVGGASAAGAVINVNANGSFSYDGTGVAAFQALDDGESTTDTFTYQVTDGTDTSTATVTITINGANDAPTVVNDAYATGEDSILNVPDGVTDLLNNDSDVDVEAINAIAIVGGASAAGAVINVNANGSFSYDGTGVAAFQALDDGESATDTFTYQVTDGTDTSTATVTITINGANDAPTVVNDAYATGEDSVLNVPDGVTDLLNNDSDVDVEAINAIAIVGGASAAGAVINVNANGSFSYDGTGVAAFQALDDGESVTDTFTYQVTDGTDTSTATVTITINGANDAPTVVNDAYATGEDNVLNVPDGVTDLLNNDSDIDVEAINAIAIVGGASAAGAVINVNANGSFSYDGTGVAAFQALDDGESATDTFTYQVTDGTDTSTATVTITINGANDAPTAVADGYTVSTVQAVNIGVGAGVVSNDTDIDIEALTVTQVNGTNIGGPIATGKGALVTMNADGSFNYDPNGQFAGTDTDSFTYTITDGDITDTATVSLTVLPNTPPTANPDSYSVTEGTILNVPDGGTDLIANDTDPDGHVPLVAVAAVVASAQGATVTINADGSFSYDATPAAAFAGLDDAQTVADTFTYQVQDTLFGLSTGTATITVTGVNDSPVAVDESYATAEDSVLNIPNGGTDLINNDTDIDGEAVNAVVVVGGASAAGAVLNINADGSFSYDGTGVAAFQALDDGESATDTFTYQVTDGDLTDTGTVTITINGANDAPMVVNDAYATGEDSVLNVPDGVTDLLNNDSDIDVEAINAIAIVGGASVAGAVVNVNANGSFSYDGTGVAAFQALDDGESATDTFTYQVTDGTDTSTATVTITINGANDAPTVVNDAYATGEDSVLNVPDGVTDLLNNDSDIDVEAINAIAIVGGASAAGAVINVNANGSFSYDGTGVAAFQALDDGESATDTFTYQVTDGTDTSTATVTITINGANDAPTVVNDAYATGEDSVLNVPDGVTDLLNNDSDIDVEAINAIAIVGGASAAGAVINVNANGSFSYDGTGVAAFQALDDGESATDTFTYQVTDGTDTSTATVTITINGANDAPTVVNDAYATGEDNVLNVPDGVTDLLNNDSDIDVEAINAIAIVGGASAAGAVINVNANGSFSYDGTGVAAFQALDDGESATDTFTYQVTDGTDTSTATVTITINGANDAPTVVNDAYATGEDNVLNVPDGVTDLLNNDSDIDVEAINAIAIVGGASAAGAVINVNANGSFSYDGTGVAAFQALDDGESATDTFTYQVTDGTDTSTATVTITINGANDAPTAVADGYTVSTVQAVNIGVGAGVVSNDTDIDIEALTVTQVNGTNIGGPIATGKGALVTMNADGSFNYDPNGQFAGTDTDSFTYTITDGDITDTATVSLTVLPNSNPIANPDSYSETEGNVLNVPDGGTDLIANDTDPDGHVPLVAVAAVVASAQGATVTINADGSFSYDTTPAAAFAGLDDAQTVADTFTYQVQDTLGGIGTGTATVTVTGVNDAPIATDDTYATGEDSVLNVPDGGSDLLNNDSDIDGEAINAIAIVGGASVAGAVVNVNTNGSFSYDGTGVAAFQALDDGESATDTFTYQVTDGDLTDTGTVTITINGANDAPMVVNDAYATGEDSVLNVPDGVTDLLNNDSDIDVEAINAIAIVGGASVAGAVVNVNANGSFSYDGTGVAAFQALDDGESATDTFTYQVTDGTDTSTATVTITINGANDAPTVVNDAYATGEDSVLNVPDGVTDLLNNDSDIDVEAINAIAIVGGASAAGAVINVNANGSFSYDGTGVAAFQALDDGESATDTFTYQVTDGTDTSTATVTITINGANDAPTVVNDAYATGEDSVLNVPDGVTDLLNNDSDIDVEAINAIAIVGGASAAGAVINVNANGSFSYDGTGVAAFQALDDGESATDTFTYQVTDGTDTSTATVTITINGANDAPTVVNDAYATGEDSVLNVPDGVTDLLNNDSDIDVEAINAIAIVGGASAAGAVINVNANGSFSYDGTGVAAFQALDDGESATDTFTYQVTDGTDTSTATVTITINGANDAPTVVNDAYATGEDNVLNVPDGVTDLLNNDSDIDVEAINAIAIVGGASAAGAVINVNANGSFSYDGTGVAAFQALDDGESATDTFTYQVTDGTDTSTATVTITINGANDAPTAVADGYTVSTVQAVNIGVGAGVVSNDTDIDIEALTVTQVNGTNIGGPIATGKGALVTMNADGSFNYDPNGQFAGTDTDSFTYTITDGDITDTATVSLTVLPNSNPIANPDSYSETEGNVLNVPDGGTDLIANDTDPDGHVPLVAVAAVVASAQGATVTINADGSFSYDTTPAAAFAGLDDAQTVADTFTYQVQDTLGGIGTGTATVTVTGVNDAPIATDDTYATGEDSVLNVPDGGSDLLNNDSDIDGEAINAIAIVGGASVAGAVVNVNTNGSFSYDGTGVAAFQALDDGESATDTFTYQVTDGDLTDTGTVTITINGANDAPTVVNDAYATGEDNVLNVPDGVTDLLNNDSDVDVEAINAIAIVGGASVAGAVVNVNANGSFSYDGTGVAAFQALDDGESVTDTFTYQVTDGTDTSTATVTITINGANDAPTVVNDAYATGEDSVLNVPDGVTDLLNNDSDIDVEAINAIAIVGGASVAGAVVNVNANGSFSYDGTGVAAFQALDDGESTTDTFTYQVTDGTDTSTATVTITINGANDAPTVVNDAYATGEDSVLNVPDGVTDLLNNDSDIDVEAINAIAIVGGASVAGAVVNVNANGSFSYDGTGVAAFQALDDGESASDTFTYQVTDGTDTSTATVTITINGANDAPIAVDDVYTIDEDSVLNVPNGGTDLTANDTDVDVEPLNAIAIVGGASVAGAVVNVNANGSFTYDGTGVAAFQALDDGESVTDTFTYQVTDGDLTDTATVTITINGANDVPTVVGDTYATGEDSVLNVPDGVTDLLNNDSDIDVETINAIAIVAGASAAGAVINVNANGSFDYDGTGVAAFQALDDGESITDTFTYQVTDGTDTSTATATITINGANDAPTAVADGYTVNTLVDTNVSAGAGVVSNDTDVDIETLTVTQVNGTNIGGPIATGKGAIVTMNADGSFTYNPNGQFAGTDTDSFTYTITDGDITDTATVSLTVVPNQVPTAVADSYGTNANAVLNVPDGGTDLIANDTDPDGNLPLNAVASTPTSVAGASVSINANGSFSYDGTGVAAFTALDSGVTTTDTFTYQVQDSLGATATGTVTVTVTGVNDAATLDTNTGATVDENASVMITSAMLSGSDVDAGDVAGNLTYTVTALPGAGSIEVGGIAGNSFTQDDIDTNQVVYLQDGTEGGTDSFTFSFLDNEGGGVTGQTFTLTINPVNDAPAISGAGDSASYFFGAGSGTVIDGNGNLDIDDPDLDFLDNYDGASITLNRNGGVDPDDIFAVQSGGAITVSGGPAGGGTISAGGTVIASIANTGNGQLQINFTDANGADPTASLVNDILRAVTYANENDVGNFTLDLSFSDGNTAAQGGQATADTTANFSVTVAAAPPISIIDLTTLNGSANGENAGVKFNGIDGAGIIGDITGSVVVGIGDVNADGRADIFLGSPGRFTNKPASFEEGGGFVIYGADTATLQTMTNGTTGFDLRDIDGTNGVELVAPALSSGSGRTASSGDFNGDGVSDLVIGDLNDTNQENAYVLNGDLDPGDSGTFGEFDLLDISTLSGGDLNGDGIDDGSVLVGAENTNQPMAVAGVGDVNNDGIEDLLIGQPVVDAGGRTDSGQAFLVFGDSSGFDSLNALGGANGNAVLNFDGPNVSSQIGRSVSGIGDINGDGYSDFIIGASRANPQVSTGSAYIIFGDDTANLVTLSSNIENRTGGFSNGLDSLDGTNGGFIISNTGGFNSNFGFSSSAIGDFNGDGFDDFVIGGPETSSEAIVVYGKSAGYTNLNVRNDFTGTGADTTFLANGFMLGFQGGTGYSVSGAGDLNGDGFDDVIIGARNASKAYAFFGTTDVEPFLSVPPLLSGGGGLPELKMIDFGATGENFGGGGLLEGAGVRFDGIAGANTGTSVAGIGDFNGDGFDDVLIGAPQVDPPTAVDNVDAGAAGQSYVVYGQDFAGTGAGAVNTTAVANDEVILGGLNDDDISSGGFSGVVIRSGTGDDVLRVNGGEQKVDAGGGLDILTPDASGGNLDFDSLTNKLAFEGFEQIQLNGLGTNTLDIDARDVLNMSGFNHQILVTGDAGTDTVNSSDTWVQVGTENRNIFIDDIAGNQAVDFNVYELAGGNFAAQLLVQDDLNINVT